MTKKFSNTILFSKTLIITGFMLLSMFVKAATVTNQNLPLNGYAQKTAPNQNLHVTSKTTTDAPLSTTATYGNWVLHCVRIPTESKESKNNCEIVQSAQVQGQSRPLMQLAIGPVTDPKEFTVTAVLPINVSIPGRVHVSADGKADAEEKAGLDLNLVRCLPAGCIAVAKFNEKLSAAIDTEIKGQIRFMDAGGIMQGIPISWVGFNQAMKALSAKQ